MGHYRIRAKLALVESALAPRGSHFIVQYNGTHCIYDTAVPTRIHHGFNAATPIAYRPTYFTW